MATTEHPHSAGANADGNNNETTGSTPVPIEGVEQRSVTPVLPFSTAQATATQQTIEALQQAVERSSAIAAQLRAEQFTNTNTEMVTMTTTETPNASPENQRSSASSGIIERFLQNPETTLLGAIGAVAPLVAPAFVPAPLVPVVYGSIAVANALLAQRDAVSAAGMGGSLLAQALNAVGVPFSEWLVALGAGFFGFFSRDAR